MKEYLLDTDVCIFFLNGRYGLVDKIDAVGKENCFISEITIAELLFGAENSQNHAKHIKEVDFFEKEFKILPINSSLRTYAKEKVRLRKKGTPVAEFDLLIAASALFNNLVAVTGNVGHFSKVKNLNIENWTKKVDNEFV